MSYSQKSSEQGTDGDASVAELNIDQEAKDFIVLTILAEDEKIQDLTKKIASHSAIFATCGGDTGTSVMITQRTWSEDWGNRPLRNLKSEPIPLRKKTTN